MSKNCCHRCLKGVSRRLPCFVAWLLLLVLSFLYFFFICPSLIDELTWILVIVQFLLFVVVVNTLLMATFTDPGRYTRAPPDENDHSETTFHKTVEIHGSQCRMKWCQTCGFYRPPRCSHCSVCDFCIDTFDHHCPWLNNCVGRRNYRYFLSFLLSVLCHMFVVLGLSIYYLLRHRSDLGDLRTLICLILTVLITLLTIPIGGLTIFHLLLILRGRTTNEQVTGKFQTNINPFDYGWIRNCGTIFASSTYPKLTQRKKSAALTDKGQLYQTEQKTTSTTRKNGGNNSKKIKHLAMTSV